MKNQKRRQHDAGKTTQGKQSRTRARVDRKCQADETVIKQLTAKQRLEHAQARSLLEYAHLKDECDRLGCSTQEFHRAAVANELARRGAAPMPATQPGLSANEQSGQAKTGKHGASAAAAPQPGGATADDTVIIQITDEQGREQVRVPFSRLEHAELKAECERRGCTMQELFIAALVVGLDKADPAPDPATPRASASGKPAAPPPPAQARSRIEQPQHRLSRDVTPGSLGTSMDFPLGLDSVGLSGWMIPPAVALEYMANVLHDHRAIIKEEIAPQVECESVVVSLHVALIVAAKLAEAVEGGIEDMKAEHRFPLPGLAKLRYMTGFDALKLLGECLFNAREPLQRAFLQGCDDSVSELEWAEVFALAEDVWERCGMEVENRKRDDFPLVYTMKAAARVYPGWIPSFGNTLAGHLRSSKKGEVSA